MNTTLQDFSRQSTEIVTRISRAMVSIKGERTRSSGFVWRSGLIVTADNALSETGSQHVTLPDGGHVTAEIVGRDPTTDIALLRIPDQTSEAVALAADVASVGNIVLAVGRKDGSALAALGVVALSGKRWQSLRGGEIDSRLELDVRMHRDAEGGLAVTADGRAFGMTVFGPRRRVLVIPSATIARVAAALEKDGRIARGYLGLGLHPVSVEGGGLGAIVMSVDPQGPGAAAGFHQGDVIVKWEGRTVERLQPLIRALGPESVGRNISFEVRRGGTGHEMALRVGQRPVA